MGHYRWVLLAGVWLVYFSFGVVAASMAPLVAVIAADLSVGNAGMGFILGAWPLVYLAAALPCGILLDRIRPRTSLLIAGAIIGISAFARALAQDEVSMFLAVAIFGIGGPLVSVGAPKLIAQLFEGSSRGTAMGIYMTGPALGSAAALALTNSLMMPLAGNDWRLVMMVYGVLGVGSGVLWFLIAGHRAASFAEPERKAETSLVADGLGALLSRPLMLLALAIATGIFFINHGLNNWLPEMLRANGLDAKSAGYIASIPTIVGIVGSLLIPRYAVPGRRLMIMAAVFAVTFVASLMLYSGNQAVLAIALIFLGFARGSLVPVVLLLMMEAPGVRRERHGLIGGLFFVAGEIGGVLGPVTIGLLSAQSGGFDTSVATLAAVAALMIVLTLALSRLPASRAGPAVASSD